VRRADNLATHVPIVLKSGSLILLEPSGPVMGLLYLSLITVLYTNHNNRTKCASGVCISICVTVGVAICSAASPHSACLVGVTSLL
jgi:hypothetical protein